MMLIHKFLDPKNDFAFKRIFGSERNSDILIHFINDILGFKRAEKIKEVEFLKTTQDPEVAAKKQSLVDVLCKDGRGRQYIIEMQVAKTEGFEKRAQYYAAKAYSGQLNSAQDYIKLKEIVFIAITDFVMFSDKTNYCSKHHILDHETYSRDLKDFSFVFIELPKFNLQIEELRTLKEKWSYFFKHAEETDEQEVAKIVGKDKVILRAYEELNRFSWDEVELNTYEQAEKNERDTRAIIAQSFNEGKEEGREEGRLETLKEVVHKLIANGQSDAAIMAMLNLNLTELSRLKCE